MFTLGLTVIKFRSHKQAARIDRQNTLNEGAIYGSEIRRRESGEAAR
jgi:hypothetical protein